MVKKMLSSQRHFGFTNYLGGQEGLVSEIQPFEIASLDKGHPVLCRSQPFLFKFYDSYLLTFDNIHKNLIAKCGLKSKLDTSKD